MSGGFAVSVLIYFSAWHWGAQHRPFHYANGLLRAHSEKTPRRSEHGQSSLRRTGTSAGATKLSQPDRGDGVSLSSALHQDAEGRRARRRGHQEYVSVEYRQRLGEPAQAAAGKLPTAHSARLSRRHVPGSGREDRG